VDRSVTYLTVAARLATFCLIGLCLWLSGSSFMVARQLDSADHSVKKSVLNPFSGATVKGRADPQTSLLYKQLEFMVWDRERQELGSQLSERLRSQINRTPFDGYLWRQLSYAEKEAGSNIQQQLWAVERASKFVRWNKRENFLLSHHCFNNYSQFKALASQFCSDSLHSLPESKNLAQLGIKVGVDTERVQAVLDQEGIELWGSK